MCSGLLSLHARFAGHWYLLVIHLYLNAQEWQKERTTVALLLRLSKYLKSVSEVNSPYDK